MIEFKDPHNIEQHASEENPHGITKTKIDLGNVPNFTVATLTEARAGRTDRFITPGIVKNLISDAIGAIDFPEADVPPWGTSYDAQYGNDQKILSPPIIRELINALKPSASYDNVIAGNSNSSIVSPATLHYFYKNIMKKEIGLYHEDCIVKELTRLNFKFNASGSNKNYPAGYKGFTRILSFNLSTDYGDHIKAFRDDLEMTRKSYGGAIDYRVFVKNAQFITISGRDSLDEMERYTVVDWQTNNISEDTIVAKAGGTSLGYGGDLLNSYYGMNNILTNRVYDRYEFRVSIVNYELGLANQTVMEVPQDFWNLPGYFKDGHSKDFIGTVNGLLGSYDTHIKRPIQLGKWTSRMRETLDIPVIYSSNSPTSLTLLIEVRNARTEKIVYVRPFLITMLGL